MSNEIKQTAVEWLISKVNKQSWGDYRIDIPNEIIEQAKEIEKTQIIDALLFGDVLSPNTAENYYKETYGGNK